MFLGFSNPLTLHSASLWGCRLHLAFLQDDAIQSSWVSHKKPGKTHSFKLFLFPVERVEFHSFVLLSCPTEDRAVLENSGPSKARHSHLGREKLIRCPGLSPLQGLFPPTLSNDETEDYQTTFPV